MAQFLVLQDYQSAGEVHFRTGDLLDETQQPISALQAGGLAVIEFVPATMQVPLTLFLAYRNSKTEIGGEYLSSLLLEAGAFGVAGTPTGTAGGDLEGTYPNPRVQDLTITGELQGSVLYFDGTNWVQLQHGTPNQVLTTQGLTTAPIWRDLDTILPDDIVTGFLTEGSGEPLTRTLVSNTLTFKSIVAGAGIALSSDSNELTIDATGIEAPLVANNTFWVDLATLASVGNQDGSFTSPFATIQQGIDAVPVGTTSEGARHVYRVLVASGTYDEDLSWDVNGRRIHVMGWNGPVNLGVFDANTWQPTAAPRRNIVISGDADTVIDNIRSYVAIGSDVDTGSAGGSVSSSFTSFRISGQIEVTATTTGNAGNIEWDLNAEVYGTDGSSSGVSFSAVNNPTMSLNMRRCNFRGSVDTGTAGDILRAEFVRFRAPVSTCGLVLWRECRIEDGLFLEVNTSTGSDNVRGLVHCSFEGLFDGSDALPEILVDQYTRNTMIANGATFGAGAFATVRDSVQVADNGTPLAAGGDGFDFIGAGVSTALVGDTYEVTITSVPGDFLPLSGGTMSGAIDMGTNDITDAGVIAVGISSPDAGAILELNSTTQAFLLPRMTTTQRDAITATAGMVIFNTTTAQHETFSGSVWVGTGSGTSSLQLSYETGNAIDVTAANGTVSMSNSTDVTDVLTLDRAFAGLGDALRVNMATGTTGHGIHITTDAGSTGTALRVDQNGSGIALNVLGVGISSIRLDGAGALTLASAANQDVSILANGSGAAVLGAQGTGNARLHSGFTSGTLDLDAPAGDLNIDATTVGDVNLQVASLTKLQVTQDGAVSVTPTSGEDYTVTTAGGGAAVVNAYTFPDQDTDTFSFPDAQGAAGAVLTDVAGDGVLTFVVPPNGSNLQAVYVNGNTIDVTAANGTVSMSNAADLTDVLTLARSFAGAGDALAVNMATGTTGRGVNVIMDAGSTGNALRVNQSGSGTAMNVTGAGTSQVQVDASGGVTVASATAQTVAVNTYAFPDLTGDSFTLPAADGGDGDVLTTDGNGALTFETPVVVTPPLQDVYAVGNTIDVTAGNGTVSISNATDLTDTLTVSRTFAGSGDAFSVNLATGTTGRGVRIVMDAGSTGNALRVDQNGSGTALNVTGAGTSQIQVDSSGGVAVASATGQVVAVNTYAFPDLTGDAFTMPDTQGAAGTVLTDVAGDGVLTFVDPGLNVSLQEAYITGNSIDVTTANDTVLMSNAADVTDVLTLSRSFAGAGEALRIDMATGTTGDAVGITVASGSTSTALRIDQDGSGAALDVQGPGDQELLLDDSGAVFIESDSGQNVAITGTANLLLVGGGNANLDANAGSVIIDSLSSGGVSLQVGSVTKFAVSLIGAVAATPSDTRDFTVTTTGGGISDFSGPVEISDSQAIDTLAISKSGAVAGSGLSVTMATGTTGDALTLVSEVGSTGTGLQVDQNGTGEVVEFNQGGSLRFEIGAGGFITAIAADGQNAVWQTGGAGSAIVRNNGSGLALLEASSGDALVESLTGEVRLAQGGADRLTIDAAAAAFSGPVTIDDSTAADGLVITKDVAGSGRGIHVAMATGTTGSALSTTLDAGATGAGLFVEQLGSGIVVQLNQLGNTRFEISAAGAIQLTGASNENVTVEAEGSGELLLQSNGTGPAVLSAEGTGDVLVVSTAGDVFVDAAAGELNLEDVLASLTLSQDGDRALTGSVFSGASSIVAAFNRLAERATLIEDIQGGLATTTGETFITKVTITLPANTSHIISSAMTVFHSTTNMRSEVRVQNVTLGGNAQEPWVSEMKDVGERRSVGGWVRITTAGGAQTLELQYALEAGSPGGTLSTRDGALVATRIS